MEWEVKAQNFLVITIIAAMLDFMIGAALGPENDEERAKGFVGFSRKSIFHNYYTDEILKFGKFQKKHLRKICTLTIDIVKVYIKMFLRCSQFISHQLPEYKQVLIFVEISRTQVIQFQKVQYGR